MPKDALVQRILKEAVEVLPAHINMIFISRQAAPRQYSRAMANNRITNMERSLFISKYFEHAGQNEQMRSVFAILSALAFSHLNGFDFDLWEDRGLQLLSSDVDATLKIQISLPMIAYQIYRGDFIKAMDIVSNHPDVDENLTLPPLIAVSLHALHASLYWHVAKFGKCTKSAEAGLALSKKTGVHLVSFMTYVNGAQGALSNGNGTLVEKYFNKMERLLHQAGKYEKAYWYLNCVWKNLIQGRIVETVRNSEMAIRQAQDSGCSLATHYRCTAREKYLKPKKPYQKPPNYAKR